jgi:hypothetical protein
MSTVSFNSGLDARERRACYIARQTNRATTQRTLNKWLKQGSDYEYMGILRKHIAIFDETECFSVSDVKAYNAMIRETNGIACA